MNSVQHVIQQNDVDMNHHIEDVIRSYAVSCVMEVLKDIIEETVQYDAHRGKIISSASFYVRRATAMFLDTTSQNGVFPAYIPPSIPRFNYVINWVEACVSYDIGSNQRQSPPIPTDKINSIITELLFNRSHPMYEGMREELWGHALFHMSRYE